MPLGEHAELIPANRCWEMDVAAGGPWRALESPRGFSARIVIGPRRPSPWPPNRAKIALSGGPTVEQFSGWYALVAGVSLVCAISGSRLLVLGVDIDAEATSEGLGALPLRAWSVIKAIGAAARAGEFADNITLKKLMGMAAGGPAIGSGASRAAELRLIATHPSAAQSLAANSRLPEDLLVQFLCDPRAMVRLQAYKNPQMPELAPSLTRHPDPAVRSALATAIDCMRWPNCVHLLDVLADDPDPRVRNVAWAVCVGWDD